MSAMRKSFITCAAVLTVSSALCLLLASGAQTPTNHDSYRTENFVEEQQGTSTKVSLSSIPAKMRFQLVRPTTGFGLRQVGIEWWKCPKTTKRPAFAVSAITYKDSKNPSARLIAIEWKHVPNIPVDFASGIPEGRIDPRTRLTWQSDFFPLLGTNHGTDIAIYSANMPIPRLKEMTQWVTADSNSLVRLNSLPDENSDAGVNQDVVAMRQTANTNARALATAVQGNAISANKYDAKLGDYAIDMGGSIPVNPCTGTLSGYTIIARDLTAIVTAKPGTHCGKWTPQVFSLTL